MNISCEVEEVFLKRKGTACRAVRTKSTTKKGAAGRPAEHHTNSSSQNPWTLKDNFGVILSIGERIGKGGFAECYAATEPKGRVFAVKTVERKKRGEAKTASSFEHEAELHRNLRHPYIVEFLQIIKDEKRISLVMDFCPNHTLSELVAKTKGLPESSIGDIVNPIFKAVAYLHRNLIHHGDLKLSNIFLDRNWNPKIGDFGFAKQLKSIRQTRNHVCGTPAYMAPEIVKRPCKFGLPSDIWSLGIIVYALLVGVTAFDAESIDKVYMRILYYDLRFPAEKQLSAESIEYIKWMLCRQPVYRPTAYRLLENPWHQSKLTKLCATLAHPKSLIRDNNGTADDDEGDLVPDKQLKKGFKRIIEAKLNKFKRCLMFDRGIELVA